MLNWRTFNALPPLRSYAAALEHFETVQPIRGDANGTKPVGRRDQKWLAIYDRDTDKPVCVGNYWDQEKSSALLAYYPDGRVSIEQNISATCRERIQRIAGLNIQRRHNEDWVHAATYQDGEEVKGHFPLKLGYNDSPRTVTFILRGGATPIYLNPTPAVTHIIDRKNKAEVMAKFKEFVAYLKNMGKLMEGKLPRLEHKEMHAAFGVDIKDYRAFILFKGYYGSQTDELATKREKLLALASSGDTEQMYQAMLWLSHVAVDNWRSRGYAPVSRCITMFEKAIMVQHKDEVLIRTEVRDGRIVHDRYASYQNIY
jgi:hypothetical protein